MVTTFSSVLGPPNLYTSILEQRILKNSFSYIQDVYLTSTAANPAPKGWQWFEYGRDKKLKGALGNKGRFGYTKVLIGALEVHCEVSGMFACVRNKALTCCAHT